jgi:hypothetical protein
MSSLQVESLVEKGRQTRIASMVGGGMNEGWLIQSIGKTYLVFA